MDVTDMKSAASQANRPRACELETSVARLKKRMDGIHGGQRLAVGFDSVPDALAHSIQDRLGPIEERPARLRSAAQRLTDRMGPRAVQGAEGFGKLRKFFRWNVEIMGAVQFGRAEPFLAGVTQHSPRQ